MNDSGISSTASHRGRNLGFGIVLVVVGIAVAALTWITVFGAVLGLLVAAIGGVLLTRLGKHPRSPDPTDAEGRPPSG